MNAEKLLPCPWCKGIPKVGVTEKTSPRDEDSGHAYVACCDTYINRQTEAEATAAWNTRAKALQQPAPEGFVIDPSILQEAGDVLEAVGASGVSLPSNWRWPLADELHGYAAMLAAEGGGVMELKQNKLWIEGYMAGYRQALQDAKEVLDIMETTAVECSNLEQPKGGKDGSQASTSSSPA